VFSQMRKYLALVIEKLLGFCCAIGAYRSDVVGSLNKRIGIREEVSETGEVKGKKLVKAASPAG